VACLATLLALASGASARSFDFGREGPVGFQQAPADSMLADTSDVEPALDPVVIAPVDSTDAVVRGKAAKPATNKHTGFDAPRWVMIRSAIIPGWGQAYNGAWLKAAGVAVVEGGLIWRLVDDRQALADLESAANAAGDAGNVELENDLVDQYNARLDDYTRRQWYLGAVFALSLLDAYIDAHFRGFKAEFEGDPALPEGSAPTARIGLRMTF
jgi:hypothetical protein